MEMQSNFEADTAQDFEAYVVDQLRRSPLPLKTISERSGVRRETLSRIKGSKRQLNPSQARQILLGLGIEEDLARIFYGIGRDIPQTDSKTLVLFRQACQESLATLATIFDNSYEADPRCMKLVFSACRSEFVQTIVRHRQRNDDFFLESSRC